jgi:hypothetical protein
MSEVTPSVPPSGARWDMVAALVVVVGLVGFVVARTVAQSLAQRPSAEQCGALLDRYLDHASRQHDPNVESDDVARAIRASEGNPTRLADLQRCQSDLTASQVECALDSPNVDELERCVQ